MLNDDAKKILCCEYNAVSSHMNTAWQISYAVLGLAIGTFGVLVARSIALIDPASPVHAATPSPATSFPAPANLELLFAYFAKCISDVCLFLFPFVLTLILGQINRAQYLLSFRLGDIATKFGETTNLWQVWPKYIEEEKTERNKREREKEERRKQNANLGWLRRVWNELAYLLDKEAYSSLSASAPFFIIIKLLYFLALIVIISSHIMFILNAFVMRSFNSLLFLFALLFGISMIIALILLFLLFIRDRIKKELDPTEFCQTLKDNWSGKTTSV